MYIHVYLQCNLAQIRPPFRAPLTRSLYYMC